MARLMALLALPVVLALKLFLSEGVLIPNFMVYCLFYKVTDLLVKSFILQAEKLPAAYLARTLIASHPQLCVD